MHVSGAIRTVRHMAPWLLLLGALGAAVRVASSPTLERADFVFNNAVEIATLDPATVTGVPEGRILRAIYEGLVVLHPETLAPIPGQAEAIQISEDKLVYTFTIRPDACWSNGDPVTASDFVFSFRRVLHPDTASEYAYQLWYAEGARAYSSWPPDRWSTHAVWAQPLDAGELAPPRAGDRIRLGITPNTLAAADGELGTLEALRSTPIGSYVSEGSLVATLQGPGAREVLVETPFSGRIVEHNRALAKNPGSLVRKPFARGAWLVEIALDEAGAARVAQTPSGEAWREEHLWPEVGIRALSERVLEIRLENPTPFFLELMAFYTTFPVHRPSLLAAKKRWPKTWQIEWVRPENLVTNGPFRIVERRINDRIRLKKNPRYWDAESVAMRTIDALAVDHYSTALNLYLTGACDWLNGTIPTDLVPRLLQREDFTPSLYLGSYFYRFNVTRPPLDDPRVRRALALSVDRQAICTHITKAGQRVLLSLVPPGMRGYKPQTLGSENLERARSLLAEAGYGPQGRPFPPLEINYNTSELHEDIAEVIAYGWRQNLGIDVQLENQEWKVFLDTQRTLKYDISRGSWIADYADPNTFLDLFVTDGENNRTGWSNPEYDRLIAEAAREPLEKRRMQALTSAERILMSELPVLPVYAYVAQNLVNPRLGGFARNSQDVHFPKFWYWKSDAELRERRIPPKKERVNAPGPPGGLYPPKARKGPAQQRAGARDPGASPEVAPEVAPEVVPSGGPDSSVGHDPRAAGPQGRSGGGR